MKPLFILIVITIASVHYVNAQRTDTIIKTGIYKSYFCFALKEPLYVTYTLFKGGGECDRGEQGFHFKKCGVQTAGAGDYSHSSFDEGHLANAEDFAFDCDKEEQTFCFYNCVPQTVKLNRGIWKTWEGKIRDLSQTQKLFIIAGAIYKDKTIGENHIGVPESCYKIVLDSRTKKIIFCLLFPNDDSKTFKEISLSALKKKLHYDLVP